MISGGFRIRLGLLLQSKQDYECVLWKEKQWMHFLCITIKAFNFLPVQKPSVCTLRCTCWWWQCWAALRTAPSTSTGLCFGCSHRTRPVPGVHSAPLLVLSPCVGGHYGGPLSHAWRRRVWWRGRQQSAGQTGNLWIIICDDKLRLCIQPERGQIVISTTVTSMTNSGSFHV